MQCAAGLPFHEADAEYALFGDFPGAEQYLGGPS